MGCDEYATPLGKELHLLQDYAALDVLLSHSILLLCEILYSQQYSMMFVATGICLQCVLIQNLSDFVSTKEATKR